MTGNDKLYKANIRMSYLASWFIREYNHVAAASWATKDSLNLDYHSKDGNIMFRITVYHDLKCKWEVLTLTQENTWLKETEAQFTNYNFKTGYAYILKQNESKETK